MFDWKLVSLLLLIPVFLTAQEMKKATETSTIQVDGEAVLQVNPDRAAVDLGVITQAQDAKTAASTNAAKLDRVIKQLRSSVGENLKIKTVGYSLSPNYVYPQQGGEPRITGYTANNTVHVETDDLAQTGSIIDVATKAGANNVQQLQFVLKDETALQAQALAEASKKARAKADAIAAAIGAKITRVVQVIEGGQQVVPIQRRSFGAEAKMEVSTPVEPGTVEVRANVTMTVEIQ
jgi:uncharacterized protein